MHISKSFLRKAALSLSLCAGLSTFAIPAHNSKAIVEQPDGTKLTVSLRGDEFTKISLTDDDYSLVNVSGVFYYGNLDSNGHLISTGRLAHDPADRSAEEQQFLSGLKHHMVHSALKSNKHSRTLNRALLGQKKVNGSKFPATGKCRTLIILVDFNDVPFVTADTYNTFNDMLNKHGYDQREHIGCAADYFRIQSDNKFDPSFDVYGPVRADKSCYYYGVDSDDGEEYRVPELVLEVAKKLDSQIDFRDYDLDGDGIIDNIYLFYAGYGQNFAGASSNLIWPHAWNFSEAGVSAADATLDGVVIESYGCCAELYGTTGTDTSAMGTFVHEFGHILGLPDFYDANYDTNGQGNDPSSWDVMASGSYLPSTRNSGAVPSSYSGFERAMLGWAEPIVIDKPQHITLAPLTSSNTFLRINTPNPYEYYIVENRQKTVGTYDYYLPSHGMLVWHIDQSPNHTISFEDEQISAAEAWSLDKNAVNVDGSHQCLEIVRASGSGTRASEETPFPGHSVVTSFTDATSPSMKTWDGYECNAPMTSISELNGNISFDFMGGTETRAVTALDATDITEDSFTANWEKLDDVNDYTLNVWKYEMTPVEDAVTYGYDFSQFPDGWTISGSYSFSDNAMILGGTSAGTMTSPTIDLSDGAEVRIKARQSDVENATLTVKYGSQSLGTIVPPADYKTYSLYIDKGLEPAKIALVAAKKKPVQVASLQCVQTTDVKNKIELDGFPVKTGDTNSYKITGLEKGTEYGYSVSAVGLVASVSKDMSVTTAGKETSVKDITRSMVTIGAVKNNIMVSGVNGSAYIELFDLTGRRCLSRDIISGQSLQANVGRGVYIARVTDENGVHSKKIFITQ